MATNWDESFYPAVTAAEDAEETSLKMLDDCDSNLDDEDAEHIYN